MSTPHPDSHRPTVLVVGGTGNLGGQIVEELTRVGARVRVLLRDEGGARRLDDAVHTVVGDLRDVGSLESACEGVETIVSAVQGGPDVIVDGQLRLLDAGQRAGVRRFIPSDYSFDFFKLPEGANVNSDWRRAFAQAAASQRGTTQVVHVLNGCFLDMNVLFGFLGAFDLAAGSLSLWGDGNEAMDFTTYRDTARFTAHAATDADVPDVFAVAGDTLTFWELKRTVEQASGRALSVVRHGSLADLDALISSRMNADPTNFYGYLPLMYWRSMLDGNGRLEATVNARYPEIAATSVAEYVARNRAAFVLA